jgi:hypothetical protein
VDIYTLREKGFLGCPHRRNLFWFQVELFWVPHGTEKGSTWNSKGFYRELKMVLPGTQKGSTWNSKGFYVELKRVLRGTEKGSTWN